MSYFYRKFIGALAICATAAPLSAFATPTYFNAEFGYSGQGITQFTSGGNTYVNGALNAPGINTATSITILNPFTITSLSPLYNGITNDFSSSTFKIDTSTGYIVNPAPNGTYTLSVPQGGAINNLSGINGPFASITGLNGDVYNFTATKDYVGGSSAGNQSSLTINVLGSISDSLNNYLATPASFQLVVSDTGGGLSFGGTFGSPPAVANVPEPAPLLLIGLGALGLGIMTRRQRSASKGLANA